MNGLKINYFKLDLEDISYMEANIRRINLDIEYYLMKILDLENEKKGIQLTLKEYKENNNAG